MADQRTDDLPEGTDTIIEGASNDANDSIDATLNSNLTNEGVTGSTAGTSTGTGGSSAGLADRFRTGRDQLSSQAGEKARGFVSQGLERTSEALANVSRMVGDTATGIEERLGSEYGDYARRAAGAIESVANSIAEKDPDELIDDTRT